MIIGFILALPLIISALILIQSLWLVALYPNIKLLNNHRSWYTKLVRSDTLFNEYVSDDDRVISVTLLLLLMPLLWLAIGGFTIVVYSKLPLMFSVIYTVVILLIALPMPIRLYCKYRLTKEERKKEMMDRLGDTQ